MGTDKKDLLSWINFFTSNNIEEDKKMLVDEKPILESVIGDYKKFTSSKEYMSAYDKRETFLIGQKMMLAEERRQGKAEGLEEGERLGLERSKYNIAKNLLAMNFSIEDVIKATSLTKEEIQKLQGR